jgi:hypothetical protein
VSISRRQVLGATALVGAAGAVGFARILPRGGESRVVVFDSKHAASLAFAKSGAVLQRIDLNEEAKTNWRTMRTLAKGKPVAGYTSWNAYVTARGWLEERGLRLVSETLDCRSGLILWSMA